MDNRKAYRIYVERRAASSPVLKNCAAAFWVGGSICLAGQLLFALYRWLGMSPDMAGGAVTVTLIFSSALLTGLGVFDRIARYAGAGTLVPVTGFANAVVSPAVDTRSEGMLLGVGGKIFTIAGPVLLFGTLCGTVYGVVYYLAGLLL